MNFSFLQTLGEIKVTPCTAFAAIAGCKFFHIAIVEPEHHLMLHDTWQLTCLCAVCSFSLSKWEKHLQ